MNEIEQYIVNALERKSGQKIDANKLDCLNYWEEGYIDSMGMFLFTVELEEKFDIDFSHEDRQSPEFKMVKSLAAMIKNKMELKGSKGDNPNAK